MAKRLSTEVSRDCFLFQAATLIKLFMFSNGWVDCWSVPIVAISIVYIYHPMPPMGPPPQANITTPEKEEILLSPIRIPHLRKQKTIQQWPTVNIFIVFFCLTDNIFFTRRGAKDSTQ